MDAILKSSIGKIFNQFIKSDSPVLPEESMEGNLPLADLTELIERTSDAISKSHAYYLQEQHADGYWWYELEANVTITAEYLMLLHFLGLNTKEKDRKMANHILKKQRVDGTWSIHWGGRGDLSTTIEAYFALKLAGISPEDPSLRKAKGFILENGGVENCRVFTKIFLALFGECDWKAIPSIPVETNLLPVWFPINIYNFSSWARSTLVPLSIVLDKKPVKSLPGHMGIRELYIRPDVIPPVTGKHLSRFSWKRFFIVLDNLIKAMEETGIRPLRQSAMEKTENWILDHQDPTGDWGGIQPAMVNSVLALASMGYNKSHDAVRKGLEALERFTIESDDELRLQSCISPIWDTALTALALVNSGFKKDHPAIQEACRWLASKQIFRKGDWSLKKPDLEPGGWAFEFDNEWYPDVDDTAVVLMLLYRYKEKTFLKEDNLEKAINWILGMQGSDGGWAAFDVDNNMKLLNQLPFSDLEATIDPSTPDLTGRVLEILGQAGYALSHTAVKRGIAFIRKEQEACGSWWGRWGVNHIYGTWSVLVGLASIGEDMRKPYIRKAVKWLKMHQNPDGGWGECCESYDDPTLKSCGQSTPSQTAWAMLSLIAAGEGTSAEMLRGVQYLLDRQKPDGTWDEEEFTGTGFPKYFMIRYHNYRNCFPLMALGKFFTLFSEKGIA